jgi:hypothetical protein
MNYSVAVTGGVMILSGIWYAVKGKKEYGGPIDEFRRRGSERFPIRQ